MRLPKKVKVLERVYPVVKVKDRYGGEIADGKIYVGIADQRDILANFMHELCEVILIEFGFRYQNWPLPDNSNYVFVMNHREFDLFIRELSKIIRQMIEK